MAVPDNCVAEVLEATAGRLTRDEAVDLLERVKEAGKRARSEGKIAGEEARVRELVAEGADQERIKKAMAARVAAINVQKRWARDVQYRALRAGGMTPAKAIEAMLVGSNTSRAEGARVSAASEQKAYENQWKAALIEPLQREMPHWETYFSPGLTPNARAAFSAFWDDVGREMLELHEKGQPGLTNNADARIMAAHLRRVLDVSRADLNRLGAFIGELKDTGYLGQWLDEYQLANADKQVFVRDMLANVDLERSFPELPAEEHAGVFERMYDRIIAGVESTPSAAEKGGFRAPLSTVRGLEHERVLHYKGYEGWKAVQSKYGAGNVGSAVLMQLQRRSKVAGRMQMFGTRPLEMVKSMAETARREIMNDASLTPTQKRDQSNSLSTVETWAATKVMLGQHDWVVNPGATRVVDTLLGINNLNLSGASLSALFTDPATLLSSVKFRNGKGLLQNFGTVMNQYFVKRRGTGEDRRVAALAGEGFDGILHAMLASATTGGESSPGVLNKALQNMFRAIGMTYQYDIGRASGARMAQAGFGGISHLAWDKLSVPYRNVLTMNGVTPEAWNVVRQAAWTGDNGTRYLSPGYIDTVPDAQVRTLVADRVSIARQAMEEDLAARKAVTGGQLAREEGWIGKRTAKLQAALAEGEAKLAEMQAKREGRVAAREQALQMRIDLMRAQLEQVTNETDVLATMDALRSTRKAADLAREIIDAVPGDAKEARMLGRMEGKLERGAKRTYTQGQQLGRRRGSVDRRIVELRRRIQDSLRTAVREEADASDEFITRFAERQVELDKFIATLRDRQAERGLKVADLEASLPARIAEVEAREIANARLDLDRSLTRLIADETGMGILPADNAVRVWTTGGEAKGTPLGAATRLVTQFASYPIAFTQRVLLRSLYAAPVYETKAETLLRGTLHIGELMATLMVAGLATRWLKDVAAGKTPSEIWDDDEEMVNTKTLLAVFLQSGAAGVYGNALQAAEFSDPGVRGQFVGQFVGPTGALVGEGVDVLRYTAQGDFDKAASSMLNSAARRVPFVGGGPTKGAVDYLFLNSLREALDPGMLRRQERRMQTDYGQEWLYGGAMLGQ